MEFQIFFNMSNDQLGRGPVNLAGGGWLLRVRRGGAGSLEGRVSD